MIAPDPPTTVVEFTVSVWPWSIGVVTVGVPGLPGAVFTLTADEGDEVVDSAPAAELSVAITSYS